MVKQSDEKLFSHSMGICNGEAVGRKAVPGLGDGGGEAVSEFNAVNLYRCWHEAKGRLVLWVL